jgi:hypothetical protein
VEDARGHLWVCYTVPDESVIDPANVVLQVMQQQGEAIAKGFPSGVMHRRELRCEEDELQELLAADPKGPPEPGPPPAEDEPHQAVLVPVTGLEVDIHEDEDRAAVTYTFGAGTTTFNTSVDAGRLLHTLRGHCQNVLVNPRTNTVYFGVRVAPLGPPGR